ncbi:MAG: ABC transporter ATP-binding protein [Phycisphaeraceae bacterium]|nr:ABC transporter ATP-binding protein [Phycisphaeraceae bacterium]
MTAVAHSKSPSHSIARAGEPVLQATNLRKTYLLGRTKVPVLRGVDLSIQEGESIAVLGASGSGKSTLLHLLGGLDSVDKVGADVAAPSIMFRGQDLTKISTGKLDEYRRRRVGFVFQFYHLLPELTVLQNVTLAAMTALGAFEYFRTRSAVRAHARELLERIGLSHRITHRPAELSGGERQRVAIARALINKPDLLLADEPTGNLDRVTGASILDLFTSLHKAGQSMVIVTHDETTAARSDRIVHLVDGRVQAG